MLMHITKAGFAVIAVAAAFGIANKPADAQNKVAVDWGTPGNAVPCDAWEKNEVAEIWSAVKPVTINGQKKFQLTLGKDGMAVGDTNVWQIVDKACGGKKQG
jgi:hypothetical protein